MKEMKFGGNGQTSLLEMGMRLRYFQIMEVFWSKKNKYPNDQGHYWTCACHTFLGNGRHCRHIYAAKAFNFCGKYECIDALNACLPDSVQCSDDDVLM